MILNLIESVSEVFPSYSYTTIHALKKQAANFKHRLGIRIYGNLSAANFASMPSDIARKMSAASLLTSNLAIFLCSLRSVVL